ncbi:MAG: hypothetical protein EX268_03675 [Deltaproteobacteria bacterium]|nr:MAG: hypothetical protein EX268_03675 [Deltaproteobacteria bacterium]
MTTAPRSRARAAAPLRGPQGADPGENDGGARNGPGQRRRPRDAARTAQRRPRLDRLEISE